MSVIDELIYNRTQADVDRVSELEQKILTQGLSSLTSAEEAEYFAGMKGAYNATDLNRVGTAIAYLADRFIDESADVDAYREERYVADDTPFHVPYDPTTVVVTAKNDWDIEDIPTQSDMNDLLTDLTLLRGLLTLPNDTPNVPVTMDYLSYTTANDIEYLLYVIDAALTAKIAEIMQNIQLVSNAYMYCGEASCGEF